MAWCTCARNCPERGSFRREPQEREKTDVEAGISHKLPIMAEIGKRNTLKVIQGFRSRDLFGWRRPWGDSTAQSLCAAAGRIRRLLGGVRLSGFGGSAGGHHRNPARHRRGNGHLESGQHQPPDRRLSGLGPGQGFVVAFPGADRPGATPVRRWSCGSIWTRRPNELSLR